jgi:hypothetical protein
VPAELAAELKFSECLPGADRHGGSRGPSQRSRSIRGGVAAPRRVITAAYPRTKTITFPGTPLIEPHRLPPDRFPRSAKFSGASHTVRSASRRASSPPE